MLKPSLNKNKEILLLFRLIKRMRLDFVLSVTILFYFFMIPGR